GRSAFHPSPPPRRAEGFPPWRDAPRRNRPGGRSRGHLVQELAHALARHAAALQLAPHPRQRPLDPPGQPLLRHPPPGARPAPPPPPRRGAPSPPPRRAPASSASSASSAAPGAGAAASASS